jgi:hypothetical protein
MIRWVVALVLFVPQDAALRHVEEISASTHEYRITQGGTMDGANCRSPLGGGFGIYTQTWESNRSVRLENVGDADLLDPWLSNGRNDFRTMKEIVAGAVKPGMSDRERALAIWRRQTTHRFHGGAGNAVEMHDPVKVYNVYGYNTCGDDSICLAGLWHTAGFKVSPGRLLGHRTSQVFFDGRWNLMDGDMGPIYLLRDNTTIACEQDLVRDHDLVKRSHPHGILDPDRRADNEEHAALFTQDVEASADGAIAGIVRSSTMSMVLRPKESIVWRWGRGAKYHGHDDICIYGPRKTDGRVWGASAADRICNGLWEYRPDFSNDGWRGGAESANDVVVHRGALTGGSIVWRMRSPYVFVGGRLEIAGSGARFSLSWDGTRWEPVGDNLDPHFPSRGPARYEYRLKAEIPAGARLERLAILNDIQMAPQAMPGMVVGENRFVYTDRSPGPRKARITHEWVERSTSVPPAAPAVCVFPLDDRRTSSTDVTFAWSPSDGADDYHFELSDRPDFAWPLSSNFEKLISNTADRGRARYRVPSAGLLNPGRTYYWHVRARNAEGVWGPWSRTWSFTPGGPEVPVGVRIEDGVLRWRSQPGPVRYRVYGSDEKGFTAGDEPADIVVGLSKEVPSRTAGNFIAETDRTEFVVLGPRAANKAFYRVVAVNDRGARSGPSDPASAPRPFIPAAPCDQAKVGESYRSSVSVIRSLGDLRLQWVDGRETASFWDVETTRFALQRGPSWLRIDERTGSLEGVPEAAGTFDVLVTVALERSVRRLLDGGPRPWNLGWGKDPIREVATERAGETSRRFQITVRR